MTSDFQSATILFYSPAPSHGLLAAWLEHESTMKIYTKTGDEGKTGLFGGPRVAKDDPRINAYGSVDELNAVLGLARTEALPPEIDQLLARVQNELFDLARSSRHRSRNATARQRSARRTSPPWRRRSTITSCGSPR